MQNPPKIQVEKIAMYTGHRDCVYGLCKGSNDRDFYSSSADGMVVKWNTAVPDQGTVVAKVDHSVYALALRQKENQLWIGHNFNGIRLVDLQENKEIKSASITTSAIFDLAEHEGRLFVATGDGTLVVCDSTDLSTLIKIKASEASARSIALHPSHNLLAVGYSDNYIRIFNLHTFALLHEWEAHQNSVFSVTFSPDGLYLLSGSRDAHLKIWSVRDFALVNSIVAHMFAINQVLFSEDKSRLATCSMDKSIKIWDATDFKLLKVIDRARHAGHGTSVNRLLWLHGSDDLVSASDDRSISQWRIQY